jgi:hypothetical protein
VCVYIKGINVRNAIKSLIVTLDDGGGGDNNNMTCCIDILIRSKTLKKCNCRWDDNKNDNYLILLLYRDYNIIRCPRCLLCIRKLPVHNIDVCNMVLYIIIMLNAKRLLQ